MVKVKDCPLRPWKTFSDLGDDLVKTDLHCCLVAFSGDRFKWVTLQLAKQKPQEMETRALESQDEGAGLGCSGSALRRVRSLRAPQTTLLNKHKGNAFPREPAALAGL